MDKSSSDDTEEQSKSKNAGQKVSLTENELKTSKHQIKKIDK